MAGRKCLGKGEDASCLGATGRIVRVRQRPGATFAKGLGSSSGARRPLRHGRCTASRSPPTARCSPSAARPTPRQFAVAEPAGAWPAASSSCTRGNLLRWRASTRSSGSNNLDGVKGDRNSNPYAVLALADRQIVVDAGANAVLEVRDGKVKLLAVIPKNGGRAGGASSIALGPDGDYYVGELAEGAGKGKARVWRIPAAGRHADGHSTGFTTITGVAFGRTAACS